nr:RNA-directed DNA polymerase, eukaryota, nucleotide-binding alpha-beta plait domain protein [Tanacetum cinerariifolium]
MTRSFRSNIDHACAIARSIFVTNFPDSTSSKDLWKMCQSYGTLVDVYIPNRRSKAGKRFAFVRFIKVDNVDRLVGNLCTLWIGRMHLHANVVRFERTPSQVSRPSQPVRKATHTGNTFASVVKGGGGSGSRGEVVEWTGEEERVVLRGWRENLLSGARLLWGSSGEGSGSVMEGRPTKTPLKVLRLLLLGASSCPEEPSKSKEALHELRASLSIRLLPGARLLWGLVERVVESVVEVVEWTGVEERVGLRGWQETW